MKLILSLVKLSMKMKKTSLKKKKLKLLPKSLLKSPKKNLKNLKKLFLKQTFKPSLLTKNICQKVSRLRAELFETVVTARLANEIESIQSELAEEAAAETAKFKEDMVEKVDQYLNYVAENWMKENELAIERGLRTEITEDFIKSLQVVFKEHYIEVPEEKYDVLGEMEQQIEELKGKLNEQIEATVELKGLNEGMLREKVIAESRRLDVDRS